MDRGFGKRIELSEEKKGKVLLNIQRDRVGTILISVLRGIVFVYTVVSPHKNL